MRPSHAIPLATVLSVTPRLLAIAEKVSPSLPKAQGFMRDALVGWQCGCVQEGHIERQPRGGSNSLRPGPLPRPIRTALRGLEQL